MMLSIHDHQILQITLRMTFDLPTAPKIKNRVTGKELTGDFTVLMWDWVSDFVLQNWNATLHIPIV